MHNFQELKVWQLAMDVVEETYSIYSSLPVLKSLISEAKLPGLRFLYPATLLKVLVDQPRAISKGFWTLQLAQLMNLKHNCC